VIPIIYLDNAATTKVTQPVLEAMLPYLTEQYGNSSSLYTLGRNAKKAIEHAREQIATAINAEPKEIFFTSGATESNNIVARSYKHIIAHNYEHHSINHQPNIVDDGVWGDMARNYVTSQMLVNNETGDIFEPLDTNYLQTDYHIDATQAFGCIPINVKKLNCDYLSLSGHKFHANKGIGILYVKNGNTSKLKPIYGGGQERGFRAGTENVASMVSMGKAAELYNYTAERNRAMESKKWYLINLLNESGIDYRINSITEKTVPNILNFSIKSVEAESILILLDSVGICVSAGSACNSGSIEPSETLKAIGVPEEYIYGTIRVSMSEFTTYEELDTFVSELVKIVNRLSNIK
jgi:cysteine desulfurase